MNRTSRSAFTALAGFAIALGGMALGAAPALAGPGDEYNGSGRTEAERDYCVANFGDCFEASNAGTWAKAAAEARYSDVQLTDGIGDAYRHCVLAGALTQRLGPDRATTLLTVHELDNTQTDASAIMDYTNNSTGVSIGARANKEGGSDTWGWIMSRCAAKADSGKLYTLQ